jgi:hypothetical protein
MASVLVAVPPMGASSVPPQLGVGYLATALRRAGHRVSLLHADRTQMSEAAFVDHVLAARPDVLGLSCLLTTGFEALRETILLVRERTAGREQQEGASAHRCGRRSSVARIRR